MRLGRRRRRMGVYSSSTAWALMPAKPNAFTPARRGESGSAWIQGRTCRLSLKGLSGRSSRGCGCSEFKVGGRTRWKRARAVLIKPGDAGGRHGVADHGRDGAQVAMAVPRRGEDGIERLELGPVGGGNAQAVAFDQGDGGRIDAGEPIGAAQCAGMSAGGGRGQSLAAAVAGDADALDECVDSIAVALGVAAGA